MRFLFSHIVIFMVVGWAHARTIAPELPAVEYCDLETTTTVALEAWRPHVNRLSLEMQGIATPIQVAAEAIAIYVRCPGLRNME